MRAQFNEFAQAENVRTLSARTIINFARSRLGNSHFALCGFKFIADVLYYFYFKIRIIIIIMA